jgi:queuine tRNA-ribosyltransferase
MGHGTVADEIKGRASHGGERHGKTLGITEDGVRFRSHIDGSEKFLAPETSMEIQAALGSDIALAFDECTPFHVTREYTERSTERTHRWLDRCLAWHAEHPTPGQVLYSISQGGVYEDMRRAATRHIAGTAAPGVAIGGSLGADKPQMYEVVGWATDELERVAPEKPRHLLGIGEVDDLVRGVELGIDTFDCAMPTRIGRHGMALVSDPSRRWRIDLTKGRMKRSREPIMEDCPCPACAGGYTRGYLHYLFGAHELTALRLVTLHNLSYIARLMADLRGAIASGTLEQVAAAVRGGAAPSGLALSACSGL